MREFQIAWMVKIFRILGTTGSGRKLIEAAGATHFGTLALKWILGYRRSFQTLDEAEKAVKPYARGGHENPANAAWHLELDNILRPSDYAAFYYIRDRLALIQRVFDLGGNVGNLYYCYKNYLPLRDDISWTVYDLQENILRGRILASSKSAHNLHFTDDLREADGADLFVASGSLHYFEEPLPKLIASLDVYPKYILINRTPLIDGPSFAIVQDAGKIRVACKLYNRVNLIDGFERLGYRLQGEWQAAENKLSVPDRPSANKEAYSGLWFERT